MNGTIWIVVEVTQQCDGEAVQALRPALQGDVLDGFTIALLSDFHYDPYCSVHPLKAAVGLVNGLRPDLIALTGDFVSAPWLSSNAKAAFVAEPCAELLREMRAPHGLWAALGSHDFF